MDLGWSDARANGAGATVVDDPARRELKRCIDERPRTRPERRVTADADHVQRLRGHAERGWAEAFAPLEAISAQRPVLAAWLTSVRSTGLLRRLAHGDAAIALALAQAAARIIERLPSRATPLSVLASTVTGDGHSLDAG